MAKLIYTAITSLDGYINDEQGEFEWSAPDEEVHAFVNDLERPMGTYLYGRRLYEVMRVWQDELGGPDDPDAVRDYADVWRAADKVVFSTTLTEPSTPKTRIERQFDPAAISAMKAEADRDLTVGGAHLAGQALLAGLVDECHQLIAPMIVGGGTRWLPDGLRTRLDLVDERRFASGFVHLHYRIAAA